MIKEASFYNKRANNLVDCFLCNHKCIIKEDDFGICRVRQNKSGKLFTLVYGKIVASHIDPIEKKPLFHFMPGSNSLSIATIGCNFQCGFCQNWQISQYSRQKNDILGEAISPENVVDQALENGCKSISYTYTEPTIFFEFAYDTAKAARLKGIANIFVTNGYMSKEALTEISLYLDAANVDLKSFQDEFYLNECKAKLQPVLDNIILMKEKGIWVEITTLVIPGKNDSEQELGDIAEFIAKVDVNIPWHISRFHPDFQASETSHTPLEKLIAANEIGKSKGLRYIYIGNVLSEDLENTICWNCHKTLIKRRGFKVEGLNIVKNKCPNCNTTIKGVWS